MRFVFSAVFCLLLVFSVFGQSSNKQIAEDFSATDLNGQAFSLNDFRGKVVLVSFWSTRCAICHSEIPKLNRMAEKYNGKDVVFIGLASDNQTKINAFLKKNPFNFRVAPDSFGVLLKYADRDAGGNINMGYPSHFLINQKGEIESKKSGWDKTASLDAQISRLLNSK
ncbi:MAG TPA: TlpA disulfide reductase family protein [Pyrinomonadaceae bacterium]|nr:TlpA disulfide reductase family protein [Pyrinomonadaceae bacterium]